MIEAGRGPVMAIGGAEDKVRERRVLGRFVALAGGERARIAIVPTASGIEDAGQRYKAVFRELGAAAAEVAFVADRAAAMGEAAVQPLGDATGIFLTGGNQMRLATILGGSRVEAAIRARSAAGAVVGGTSAGASILSRHMVAFGASGSAPRQQMAQLAAGFGLLDGAIIDQHFRERDRIGRLLALVALNPGQLGVGIDEDTAALFHPAGLLEVIGRGTVTIVDGHRMRSDADRQPSHRPLTVTDIALHALADGARFDLKARQLVAFPPVVPETPGAMGGEGRRVAADDRG